MQAEFYVLKFFSNSDKCISLSSSFYPVSAAEEKKPEIEKVRNISSDRTGFFNTVWLLVVDSVRVFFKL